MTNEDLKLLKESVDKVVRIVFHKGETMVATVHFVSDEDADVICDLVSATDESHYEKHDKQPAYLLKFKDILRVEPV